MPKHEQTDLDALQGTWHITALETEGEESPAPVFADAKIIIDGNKFTSLGMGDGYEGTITLDPTKQPKAFDLAFTAGPPAGTTNFGIYTLDGDRWTICLSIGGKRPRTFATQPDSGLALEVLERGDAARPTSSRKKAATSRSKSSAVAPAVEPSSGPPTTLEGEWAMVAAVFNGVPMAEKMVQWAKRVTRGDVTTVTAGPQVMLKARFTLDESHGPHRVDYVNIAGSNKGKLQAGIFALNGKSLEICMAAPGKPRPADFFSKPGDGRSYTTWRLEKK